MTLPQVGFEQVALGELELAIEQADLVKIDRAEVEGRPFLVAGTEDQRRRRAEGCKVEASPTMPLRSRSSTSTASSSKVARAYCFSVEVDTLRDHLICLDRAAE